MSMKPLEKDIEQNNYNNNKNLFNFMFNNSLFYKINELLELQKKVIEKIETTIKEIDKLKI